MMRLTTSIVRRAAIVAALVTSVACSSDTTAPSAPMTGEWKGSASGVTFDMNVADNSGTLAVTGTVSGAAGTLDITATGTHSGTHVTATISSSGFSDVSFVGELSDGSHLAGTLNGSGFSNTALTLTKQ